MQCKHFSIAEQTDPIGLIRGPVIAETGDNRLVRLFNMIISIRIVGGVCQISDLLILTDGGKELIDELGSTAGQRLRRCTVWDDPMVNEAGCGVGACYFSDGSLP